MLRRGSRCRPLCGSPAKPSTSECVRMSIKQINNEVYRRLGHTWWDEESEFASLRFFINPVRFGYFSRVFAAERGRNAADDSCLDVGCGGGFLSEEFARAGFCVTGIDPAEESLEAARAHAAEEGLSIAYRVGTGEAIPFPERFFDVVLCCDVLEHVRDPEKVIEEVARVLKPDGLFFYDTINRTFASRIMVIKAMQEWPWTAFAERNSHIWDKFIKPDELPAMFDRHGLANREMRGITSRRNPFANLIDLRRRAKGEISLKELGRRLAFHESRDLSVSYMGYALKRKAP